MIPTDCPVVYKKKPSFRDLLPIPRPGLRDTPELIKGSHLRGRNRNKKGGARTPFLFI